MPEGGQSFVPVAVCRSDTPRSSKVAEMKGMGTPGLEKIFQKKISSGKYFSNPILFISLRFWRISMDLLCSSVFFRGEIVGQYSEPEVTRRKNAVTFVFFRVVCSDFESFLVRV